MRAYSRVYDILMLAFCVLVLLGFFSDDVFRVLALVFFCVGVADTFYVRDGVLCVG